jgi:DNA polymerase/3'-5' exonuclease PolX
VVSLIYRSVALEKAYSLSEYGLLNLETEENVELQSEKEIYQFLGMRYLKPDKR